MVHVFVFVGEFGYELLNWHGVVRKFARARAHGNRLVCASRANVYPLYEMADLYVDVSDVPRLRESRAVQYSAALTRDRLTSLRDLAFDRALKAELRPLIRSRMAEAGLAVAKEECRFIFSSDGQRLDGCAFGHVGYRYRPFGVFVSELCALGKKLLPDPWLETLHRLKIALLDRMPSLDYRGDGDIYERLDLDNNVYRLIEPDLGVRRAVEERLGASLDRPYILCQARRRQSAQASPDVLPEGDVTRLLQALSSRARVVLLTFNTGRWLDSYSDFSAGARCSVYPCRSFPEQACLVHFASRCLFFTEGDLGSHTYVPPFLGRDVTIVAPRSVFQLPSAPISFWNRNVFRFGGQMIPEAAEEALSDPEALATRVLARAVAARTG